MSEQATQTASPAIVDQLPKLAPVIEKLRAFRLPASDRYDAAELTETVLYARLAERNLFLGVNKMSANGQMLRRKAPSPIDSHEHKFVGTEMPFDRMRTDFGKAMQSVNGHIIFTNHTPTEQMPGAVRDFFGISGKVEMTRNQFANLLAECHPVVTREEMDELQETIGQVYKSSLDLCIPLVMAMMRATNPKSEDFAKVHGEETEGLREMISSGLTNRFSFDALILAATRAVLNGSPETRREDVLYFLTRAGYHRVGLTAKGLTEKFDARKFVDATFAKVVAMSTQDLEAIAKDENKKQLHSLELQDHTAGHVHGPDCNHGHDHAGHVHGPNCKH
jgi:hypothetical protein